MPDRALAVLSIRRQWVAHNPEHQGMTACHRPPVASRTVSGERTPQASLRSRHCPFG